MRSYNPSVLAPHGTQDLQPCPTNRACSPWAISIIAFISPRIAQVLEVLTTLVPLALIIYLWLVSRM